MTHLQAAIGAAAAFKRRSIVEQINFSILRNVLLKPLVAEAPEIDSLRRKQEITEPALHLFGGHPPCQV